MRVLFVTSECETLFKRGGLADVSYSLPIALSKQGVHVAVVMPFYQAIKIVHVTCVGQLSVEYDRRRELVFVFTALLSDTKVPVYFLRHPRLDDYFGPNIADTFAFFSKCVAELYLYSSPMLGGPYDIVHCNDWHTALVPLLLGERRKVGYQMRETIESEKVKTIVTIHNLLYKGETGIGIRLRLGLPSNLFHAFTTPMGTAVKLLREGLEYADIITTVSPTYAKEMIAGTQGDETKAVLAKRKDRLVGILNGIDEKDWDPRNDKALLKDQYGWETANTVKPKIKRELRRALRLPESDAPLFGFIGRLETRQKGIDLIEHAIAELPKDAYQLVLLGTGSPKQVSILEHLATTHRHIAFVHTFDERLARKIYAGADVLLVPSKFEPCGLTQMIAMRYGTLPLVRKTGGLADSVTDGQNGFVFGPYTGTALASAMKKAILLFQNKQNRWHTMIQHAMKTDFSWDRSAKEYKRLYQSLLK